MEGTLCQKSVGKGTASRLFQTAEGIVRRAGLRRSRFGRIIISALNGVGRFGLKIYFLLNRGPVDVQGQRIDCHTWQNGSFRSTVEFLLDRYEPETTRLFHRLLRPGMTVVDIGAHGGYFSLIAASCVGPTGKVYAFEPYPANFAALRKNIALNGYENVTAIARAVTDKTSKTMLRLHAKGSDRHSLYDAGGSGTNALEIETITLDDFLEGQKWPRVDLIKMDIEGAEPAALAGMRQALTRCAVCYLVTEFSPPSLSAGGFDPEGFLQRLLETGFSLFVLEGQKPRPVYRSDLSDFVRELSSRGGTNLFCESVGADETGNRVSGL